MNPEIPPTVSVVLDVIDILDELGVRYHLGGSFASAIHGVPRQTMDADLVVDLDAAHAEELVKRLSSQFYVDLDVAKEAAAERGSFNAIHLETAFKVDFFVKKTGEYDEIELARSELTQVTVQPPRSVYVKTAEDVILRKLQWFREGGEVSDRQWRDVAGVLLAAAHGLDQSYLRHWASKLGLADLLERAISEANPD